MENTMRFKKRYCGCGCEVCTPRDITIIMYCPQSNKVLLTEYKNGIMIFKSKYNRECDGHPVYIGNYSTEEE
jgi:hypothetical protein